MGLCVVMNRCAAVEGGAEGGEGGKEKRKEVGEEVVGEEELEVDYWECCCLDSPSDCCLVYHVVHSQLPNLLGVEEVFERYGDLGRHDGVDCS